MRESNDNWEVAEVGDEEETPLKKNSRRRSKVIAGGTAPVEPPSLYFDGRCLCCFPPGTLVRTEKGYEPIEKIRVGDLVLTGSGNFAPVKRLISRMYEGELASLRTTSSYRPLYCTLEHPFRVVRSGHTGPCRPWKCNSNPCDAYLDWVPAEEIRERDWIATPVWNEESDLTKIVIPGHNSCRNGREVLPLTSEVLWAIGMYLAEGCKGTRSITYSLHENETEYIERLQSLFLRLGYGTCLSYKRDYVPGNKGVQVIVSSTTLEEWWPQWLGSGCAEKRIPEELLNLPIEKLAHVYRGVRDGDAEKHAQSPRLGQTSLILALQMSEIEIRLGGRPTASWSDKKGKRTTYLTNFGMGATNKRGTWKVEDRLVSRVREVGRRPYSGPVYNLEVEGSDPSYTTEGLVVHNCTHEYRKTIDKLCVTSNISPTEIGRMFGVSRASVTNHGKNHLDYAEASIRRVIEAEASATQENVEDGVRGILARRVFLSSYIQRTMEALLSGDLPLSGKEAMAAINMLTQYEESETVAQMQELQDQFNAFQQAMKEIVPTDDWYAIVSRTEEIYKTSGMMVKLKQITEGKQDGV
jgi:hypothetical protein